MDTTQSMKRSHSHGLALALLTALFACRVGGQAVQRVSPQAWLPAFSAFQGSRLPYWALLGAQLVILTAMIAVTRDVYRGRFRLSSPAARRLRWAGALYMGGSLLRLAIGLGVPQAPAWFSAWIPAVFHVVLAGWLLLLATWARVEIPEAAHA